MSTRSLVQDSGAPAWLRAAARDLPTLAANGVLLFRPAARYLPVPAERIRDPRYPSADPQEWRSCQMTLRPKDQPNDASAASKNVSDNQCSPWVSLKLNAASRATA
jgi:hypothetical protein